MTGSSPIAASKPRTSTSAPPPARVGGARPRRCRDRPSSAKSGSRASTAAASRSRTPIQPGRCRSRPRRRISARVTRRAARHPVQCRVVHRAGPHQRWRGEREPARRDAARPARRRTPARPGPSCRGVPPASSQACAAADRRVSGEGQLSGPAPDPHPVVGLRVGRRQQERRLRQVGPVGEAGHLLVGQTVGVVDDRDRVPAIRLAGEHVDLAESTHGDHPGAAQAWSDIGP